jgi:hypothetical protein
MFSGNIWSLLVAVLQFHLTWCYNGRCLLDKSEVESSIWPRLTNEVGSNVSVEEMYYNCVSFRNDMKTVYDMKVTVFTNKTDYFTFKLMCSSYSYKMGELEVRYIEHNRFGEKVNQTMCTGCSQWTDIRTQ